MGIDRNEKIDSDACISRLSLVASETSKKTPESPRGELSIYGFGTIHQKCTARTMRVN